MTACNPPCAANESCSEQGECVAEAPAAARRSTSEDAASGRPTGHEPKRPVESERPTESQGHETNNANYVAIGGTALVAKGSIAGFTIAAGHVFGDTHGFLVGLRSGIYFGGGASAPLLGADLGYRGFFYTSDSTRVGIFAVGQFQAYLDSPALIFGGVAVGPMFEFGHFHVQAPLGVGIAAGAGQSLTAGQFGLLAGVAF